MRQARQLPLWAVNVRARFRRRRSLRWRTHEALRQLESGRSLKRIAARLSRSAWSAIGRAWVLPSLSVALVVALQVFSIQRAPLAVFHDGREARELLGLLWQAEAAAVALVLAASLFAFESLTRQRSNLPLVEYANKSRLMQFLMLSASGLIAVPVALFATPDQPAPAASFAAALVAMAAFALLPAFLTRATRVVHPDWMQQTRLDDIRTAVNERVRRDAFERMGLVQLNDWIESRAIELGSRFFLDDDSTTESSPAAGVVTDIDLDRLELLARRQPEAFSIVTRLHDRVSRQSPLIARRTPTGSQDQEIATVTPGVVSDEIVEVVDDLHEEALEAIRRASPNAAERVMATYAATWLAWPRAWERYGQRMEGGLLDDIETFRIRPSDQLRRHVWLQTQTAIDQGFRDFIDSVMTLVYSVAYEAHKLRAADLINEMYKLARLLLTIRSDHYPEAADSLIERVWRAEISMCEDAARVVEGKGRGDKVPETEAVGQLKTEYRHIIESMKVLLDQGRYEHFANFDNRFRQVLEFWNPSDKAPLAEHILEDPQRFNADEQQLERARAVLGQADSRRELLDFRRGGRLALLGWLLHKSADAEMSEELAAVARSLGGTLGSVPDVVRATGMALRDTTDLLSNWVMVDMPEGRAGFVDTDGPALTALSMVLLARGRVGTLPPADWMSEHRIERLRNLVPEVAERAALWGRLGEDLDEVRARVDPIVKSLSDAESEQRQVERDRLIEQELDPGKVEKFRQGVVAGWRENRGLDDLTARTQARINVVPAPAWDGQKYGWSTLDPKGLFVTPTNWVGLDSNARDYGRQLAQAEISAIVRAVVNESRGVRGKGGPQQRLGRLLDALRADGFEPSLILLPIDWRLAGALGVRDREQPLSSEGLGSNIKGAHDGIPVIDWWDVPDDRIYALDLGRFCEIKEATDEDGSPLEPSVEIEEINDASADDIISSWEAEENEAAEFERRQRVLTSVRTEIFRPYQLEVLEGDAARSMKIPGSYLS